MNPLKKAASSLALVGLLMCSVPVAASAQVGHLRAYSDAAGTNCDLQDPGGFLTLHVFHEFFFGGAIGSRFRLETPSSWIYLNFVTGYAHYGVLTEDLSVAYGECASTRTYIGEALYFSGAQAAACSQVSFRAPESIGLILGADCSGNDVPMSSSYGVVVNPVDLCCCLCLATEQRTWGSVKALYR